MSFLTDFFYKLFHPWEGDYFSVKEVKEIRAEIAWMKANRLGRLRSKSCYDCHQMEDGSRKHCFALRGFCERESPELFLSVPELAANICKHYQEKDEIVKKIEKELSKGLLSKTLEKDLEKWELFDDDE